MSKGATSNVEPLPTGLRQTALLDTKQVLQYIKPLSHHTYWNVMKKDPRWPKPVQGGNGSKEVYGRAAIDLYLEEVARTGFMSPEGLFLHAA